ncbi:MAG: sugar phosphate isomerase/epimerase family protein [Spirochaetota bacterium]
MRPPISGFTYHIVPDIQKDPSEAGRLLAPFLRDGYWKTFQIPPVGSRDAAAKLGAVLRLAGVRPTFDIGGTVTDGELNLQSPDPVIRAKALETAEELVDQAYLIGARVADFNPGPDPGPETRTQELANLADSLARLCDYAAEKAADQGGRRNGEWPEVLTISLEHFDREVDKRRILGPTEEAAEFIRGLRRRVPNIGLTMDLSHLVLLGEDPKEAVTIARSYVTNAHLSNCIFGDRNDPRWGDRHPPFFVPGGTVDAGTIEAFVSGLQEIGYFAPNSSGSGMLTFQVKPAPEEDPFRVAAGCRRLLEEVLAGIA